MRSGQRVVINGQTDGVITSGTYSPTLGKSIAFARVPVATGDSVMVDIRGTLHPATVCKPRFVKQGQPI
jgi:aminomethyltransferase